ncbi:hypothetical protein GALL_177610 [mine drainage metagenome]|uniref:Uncharacterized protein n=1 Tax=mine drainage metagenome TaxID=410659 RepID=A0A1J5SEI1_9ZZZZ
MPFSVGFPLFLPSASRPLLMQMPSSPTSKVEFSIMKFLQLSTSIPSPFCAYHGFFAYTFLTIRSSHIKGCKHHAGEFWNVIPSSKTLLQLVNTNKLGRKKSLMSSKSFFVLPSFKTPGSFVREPLKDFSEGYHVFLSSLNNPPLAILFFHCVSFNLSFLTIRHASPFPSTIPEPVIAIFSALFADNGD